MSDEREAPTAAERPVDLTLARFVREHPQHAALGYRSARHAYNRWLTSVLRGEQERLRLRLDRARFMDLLAKARGAPNEEDES